MTVYTLRDSTRRPITAHDTLSAAVDAMETECSAHDLDPDTHPGSRLELCVTAGASNADTGDVVVHRIHAAGGA